MKQFNLRTKENHKTSSALNQAENILEDRQSESFWCVERDPEIAVRLGEGMCGALRSAHDPRWSTSCPQADSWARVSASEYISGSQFVAFSSCYCIQVTELPLLNPSLRGRVDTDQEGGTLWWCYGAVTAWFAHEFGDAGWLVAGRHMLGGLALFTPSAAHAALFKQSGCLHKLPLSPWTSSSRRVLMWPFPGAPWAVCAPESETLPAANHCTLRPSCLTR